MSDFTPTARTTPLEAVNAVLLALGKEQYAAAPTFGTDQLYDSVQNTIDMVTREVLSEGWHFNTVLRTLTVSGGAISVPSNCITVDAQDPYIGQKGDNLVNLLTNSTTGFTSNIECICVLALQFVECPEPIRQYIVARSARKMAHSFSGETEFLTRIEFDETRARARAMSFEHKTRNKNLLTQPNVQYITAIRRRIGPYRFRRF